MGRLAPPASARVEPQPAMMPGLSVTGQVGVLAFQSFAHSTNPRDDAGHRTPPSAASALSGLKGVLRSPPELSTQIGSVAEAVDKEAKIKRKSVIQRDCSFTRARPVEREFGIGECEGDVVVVVAALIKRLWINGLQPEWDISSRCLRGNIGFTRQHFLSLQ